MVIGKNVELNAKKTVRPDTGPSPRMSDLGGIPSFDAGHGNANFPNYAQPTVGGIPHCAKLEDITPAAGNGQGLDLPGATRGERGL